MTASSWSTVDDAPDPSRLLRGLDVLRAEPFFAQSKIRMATVLVHARPTRVLDMGCGSGEDAVALSSDRCTAVGVERSVTLSAAARDRSVELPLIVADAVALPLADASVDAIRADRLLQHLPDAPGALREWRRVLRPGGTVVCFDPDLTTATVEGVDRETARTVLAWRLGTRPGASTVHAIDAALETSGFTEVRVESPVLELDDLGRADGIMGLATWGNAAAEAGLLAPQDAPRWSDAVHDAWRRGTLRYRCTYVLAIARAGARGD